MENSAPKLTGLLADPPKTGAYVAHEVASMFRADARGVRVDMQTKIDLNNDLFECRVTNLTDCLALLSLNQKLIAALLESDLGDANPNLVVEAYLGNHLISKVANAMSEAVAVPAGVFNGEGEPMH